MPSSDDTDAVIWDPIDWNGIQIEEEKNRRDEEDRARIGAEKRKAAGIQPTAGEIERAKLEVERQTLESERQALESERKRMMTAEAARKADDTRRGEAERIEEERREQAALTQRKAEEESRREVELHSQRAREDKARLEEEARLRAVQDRKLEQEEEQRQAREQRVTVARQSVPPPLPGGSLAKPWGGEGNVPMPELTTPRRSRGALGPAFQPAIHQSPTPTEEPPTLPPPATPIPPPAKSQAPPAKEQSPSSPLIPNPPKKRSLLGSAFDEKGTENTDKERAD